MNLIVHGPTWDRAANRRKQKARRDRECKRDKKRPRCCLCYRKIKLSRRTMGRSLGGDAGHQKFEFVERFESPVEPRGNYSYWPMRRGRRVRKADSLLRRMRGGARGYRSLSRMVKRDLWDEKGLATRSVTKKKCPFLFLCDQL